MSKTACDCVIDSMELHNPGVQYILGQLPYEIMFLDKISTFTRSSARCFDIAVQGRKNMMGGLWQTVAIEDPTAIPLTLPAEWRNCVTCNYFLKLGSYLFHIKEYDCNTGVALLEAMLGQSIPATIPAGSYFAVMSNSQGICAWNVVCAQWAAKKHTVNLQEVGDCWKECKRGDEQSRQGALENTINWSADNFESMLNRHFEQLDWTLWGMIPTKELDAGCAGRGNYTTGGYMNYVNQYGYCSDQKGEKMDPKTWKKWGYELSKRRIRNIDCIYMNSTTRCALEEDLSTWCKTTSDLQKGSSGNVIGASYDTIHIPGINKNAKVILWDECIGDGEIIPVASSDLEGVTMGYEGQNWIAASLGEPNQCKGQIFEHEYSSMVALKVERPELTSKIVNVDVSSAG